MKLIKTTIHLFDAANTTFKHLDIKFIKSNIKKVLSLSTLVL